MTRIVQVLLLVQVFLYVFAAGAHAGLFGDRDDPAAAGFETLIGVVLAAALIISVARPGHTLTAARAAQGFALVLTIVGFTLVLTVGPTTAFDVTMHLTMLLALVVGLAVTVRAQGGATGRGRRLHA